MGYELLVTSYRLLVTSYRLLVTSYELRVVEYVKIEYVKDRINRKLHSLQMTKIHKYQLVTNNL